MLILGHLAGWIIAELVVGVGVGIIAPRRVRLGIFAITSVNILGAIVGGLLGSLVFGPNPRIDAMGAFTAHTAWPGWFMAVLGGLVALWIAIALVGSPTSGRVP
jgi:hypothetical protein